jgi:hypothetical protein
LPLERADIDLRVLAPREPELDAPKPPAAVSGEGAAAASSGQAAPVYRFGWKQALTARGGAPAANAAAAPKPADRPLPGKKPAQASNAKSGRKPQQQPDKIAPSAPALRGMKPAGAVPPTAAPAPSAVGLGSAPKPRPRANADGVADRPMQLM